jgi:hypothetical protein
MTLTSFKKRRAQILSNLRKTNKGGLAFEMHINKLRILHVEAGAEIVKQAGRM